MSIHRRLAIQQAKLEFALKPVYLDTETTGLDGWSEIVEICIVDYDGATLLDTLVKPRYPIPPDATAVHGITNQMVRTAPTWAQVWNEIHGLLKNRRVAIYNAEYDVRLMQQSHDLHALRWTFPDSSFWCVMKLYADYYGEWDSYHGNNRWQKLGRAADQCGISMPNVHRARGDALLSRAVHVFMAQQDERRL